MLDDPAASREEGCKASQPFDYTVGGLRALNTGSGEGSVGSFLGANQREKDESDLPADSSDMTAPQTAKPPDMTAPADDAAAMAPTDAASEARAKRRKAFQTARALGQGALRRMGQPTWLPPSPAGFEEGFSAWITGSQLAERLAWARRASTQFGQDEDPREFLKSTLGDAARDETIRVVSQAPNKISGLTLVLASPEFNRR